MNIQTDCKTRADRGVSALFITAYLMIFLISGTILYGQEFMRPDGTIGSSKAALSEALPGEFDNTSIPEPQFPPGIMPDKALSVDPTAVSTTSDPLAPPPVPSFDGNVNSMSNVLPSSAAKNEKSSFLNLYNAPGSSSNADRYEGMTISDVKIEGNQQYSFEKIVPYLQTRPGRQFSKKILEDDVRRLIYSRMFVNVETLFKEVSNGGHVELEVKFRVSERRTIQYIRYVGNEKIRKKYLEKEALLRVGGAVDPSEVVSAKERLEGFYRSKGFARATVTIVQGMKLSDPGIIFQINEGPKQKVHWTSFEGNTIVSDARLRTQVQSKHGFLWIFAGELDYEKLDADVRTLEDYYKNLGFLDVRVGREVKFNSSEEWADVIFYIHEGKRYKIRDIVIAGANSFTPEQIKGLMEIDKGDYLNKVKLTRAINKIQGRYGTIGRVFADVKPDVRYLETPGQCDIVVSIKEGDVYRVGRVNVLIAGDYPQTQIDTVLNRMTVKPGDIMDTNKIRASERRLKASQLFANDPQKGVSPSIVYSPPEIKDMEKRDGERMAEPITRPEKSNSFRGQNDDYRHVAHYTPSDSISSNQKTVDVNYYGTWNENNVEWQNVELNSSDGSRREILIEGSRQEAVGKSEDPTAYCLLPTASNLYTESFEEYNNNSVQQEYAREDEQRRSNPRFLGQSGYQTTYGFDPFGQPSVPSTRAEVDQTVGYPTLQQSVYNQPVTSAPATQTFAPASANRTAVVQNNWMPAGGVAQDQNATVSSQSGAQLAPYSGAVGQNVYSDNLPMQPGIPAPNSPTGQSGSPYPAVQSFDQNYSGNYYYQTPIDGPNTIPIAATLEETRTGRMMFSIGISSESGLLGSVVIEEQNFDWLRWPRSCRDWYNGVAFRGRGQHFRLEASPGTNVQRYSISFGEPYLLNTDISWDISGVYYERFYDEWYEKRLGGQTSFGYRFHKDLVGYLTFRGYNIHLYHPVSPTPPELEDALGSNALYGIGAKLVYDKRDSPYMATEGWYMSAEFEQVFGSYTYPRASFSVKKFIPLYERPDGSGRHVLSLKTSVDWTDVDTPIYEHYFTGGISTIRGFRYRKATVRDMGVPVGGYTQVLACAEYLFPITADDMVKGVIFCDTGTSDYNFGSWKDRYRASVGFGFRITVPMMGSVPIALDFAFPVSKNDFDETEIFSFTMGGMF
ncbi:MAG: BamA/TamA family outer membrane protein [Thermoguttaceae bacterium]|nr:BamA/TamA family outer membrane protein [Thermoguttaceae bacterium]